MPRETVEPTVNEYGADSHPAFAQISASRGSYSGEGQVLFDSDVKHQHTVTIRVTEADRRRSNGHDYIHGGVRQVIEVEMSEAQWASFVSSMNTTGVPCTLRGRDSNWEIPGLPYDPRLAHSMREVRDAARTTFATIKEALADYEAAVEAKAGARVIKEKLRTLHFAVEHTEGNLTFASKTLIEHGENVVQRARADIEAMVYAEAQRLGISSGAAAGLLALPAMPDELAAADYVDVDPDVDVD